MKSFEKYRSHKLSKNLYSKLKLNMFSLLELFMEFSQFLSGATKVSNKIKAVELTSTNNSILSEQHSYLAMLIIIELFSICMPSVLQRA